VAGSLPALSRLTTSLVLPPSVDSSYSSAGPVTTLISPARSRFSWLRIRIVVPSSPGYAPMPSKIPGVGRPSLIGVP
jgi:hypothetical protein